MKKFCEIQTDKIVNGSNMFRNMPIIKFSGDLSSLQNGENMFRDSQLELFDWKGGADVTSNNFNIESSANMFDGCYLNSESVENIYDMLASTTHTSVNPNTQFVISLNRNDRGATTTLGDLFGLYFDVDYLGDFITSDTINVTMPNGLKFTLLGKVEQYKAASDTTYADRMFYNWSGDMVDGDYSFARLIIDVGQMSRIKSAYQMFYDAGFIRFEKPDQPQGRLLGDAGYTIVLEVKGNFPNLENAEEMFAMSTESQWLGTLGGASGRQDAGFLHLDLNAFNQTNPCKITKLTNMVNGRNIDDDITFKTLLNIAQNSLCDVDDYMGYIFTGTNTWAAQIVQNECDINWGNVTGINVNSTEAQIRSIFEGYGWTVKDCRYTKLPPMNDYNEDWSWGSDLFTLSTTNLLGKEITLGVFTPYGSTVPCQCWDGNTWVGNGIL